MKKEKVHMNDILESEIQVPRKILVLGEKKYYADRISKEQLSTHRDCERCNKEFEKDYTNQKYCSTCSFDIVSEKYNALELVEWDGKTPLVIYNEDQYFYDMDDILEYCEYQETEIGQLRLCLCKSSSFSTIGFDYWQDDVHENWEPDKEMLSLVAALNKYLQNTSTGTWFQDNKRVTLHPLK